MQKPVSRVEVVGVVRGGVQAVNETGDVVDANMQLHTEMAIISFPGLVHLRVALLSANSFLPSLYRSRKRQKLSIVASSGRESDSRRPASSIMDSIS